MRVRDGVYTYQLNYEMFDGDNALCVHVVETDEAVVQFGAGHESTDEEVVAIARDHDVDVVVAEHGDGDHYGGFDAIREDWIERGESPPTFAVPAGDADWLAEAGVAVDVELTEEPRWGIQPIDAPGHTPGNMSYLYEDVLIAGDTLVGSDFGPIAVDDWSGAFGIVPPSRNTGGDDRARQSVEKLLEYDFETALVSHGSNVLEGAPREVETLVHDLREGIDRTDF